MTPEETVRSYLDAMERRDLAAARSYLAPGFHMMFPGNRRFDTLEQLVDWARGRYKSARKTYSGYETAGDTVYCFGTLSGEWLDGAPYGGIRFIDRFTLRDGKLVDQNVWNDLAEAALSPGAQRPPR